MKKIWILIGSTVVVFAITLMGIWSVSLNANADYMAIVTSENELQAALQVSDEKVDITIANNFSLTKQHTISDGKNITIHSDDTHRIIQRSATYAGRFFAVNGGSELTFNDITLDGNKDNTGSLSGVSTMILVGSSGNLANYGTLNIGSGAVLQNNNTTNSDSQRNAGAVVVREASTLNMTGGKVINNTAAGNGGGAFMLTNNGYTGGGTTLNISGGEIANNASVYRGGAIYLQDKGDTGYIDISGDADIHNNAANGAGAGIFVTGEKVEVNVSGKAKIRNNTVSASSYGDGGGFALNTGNNTGQNLTISGDVEITGNTASGKGGGIYANDAEVTIYDNVLISNNQSSGGGGINLSGGTRGFIDISDDVKVNNNSVKIEASGENNYGGGGIKISGNNQYLNLSNNVQVNENEVFADNTWSGKGGGVYVSSCNDMRMSDNVQVNNNQAANSSNNNWSNNGANGGGVYFYGSYCNSRWMTLDISGGQINNNISGGQGGGLYINTAGDFTLADTQINGNSARDNGGGIEFHSWTWNNYPTPTVVFSGEFEINGNIADNDEDGQGDGGGIYVSSSDALSLNLSSGEINNNKAVAGGAMRFNGNGELTLGGNVKLNNNTAYTPERLNTYSNANGGAIDFASSSGWVTHITDDAELIENSAGWQGGAIHAGYLGWSSNYASTLTIDGNANISNNQTLAVGCANDWICANAGTGGGALYLNNAYDTGVSVTIGGSARLNNNTATNGQGGAIRMYQVEDAVSINDDVEICDNKAVSGGGISEHGNTNLSVNGNVKLCNNTAESNGGAINLNAEDQYINLYDNVNLINNTAGSDGGGIYVEYDYLNRIYVDSKVKFFDNKAQNGRLMDDSTDIALHQNQIFTDNYSWDFNYAYNNYDIAYNKGQIVHVARVKFDTDGAKTPTPDTQYYWRSDHSKATEPSEPVRDGYIFIGWKGLITTCDAYDNVLDEGIDCSSVDRLWNFDNDVAYEDTTLAAQWEKIPSDDETNNDQNLPTIIIPTAPNTGYSN